MAILPQELLERIFNNARRGGNKKTVVRLSTVSKKTRNNSNLKYNKLNSPNKKKFSNNFLNLMNENINTRKAHAINFLKRYGKIPRGLVRNLPTPDRPRTKRQWGTAK
jgi:hypothetical protein